MIVLLKKAELSPTQAKLSGCLLVALMLSIILFMAFMDYHNVPRYPLSKLDQFVDNQMEKTSKNVHLMWRKELEFELKAEEEFCIWETLHLDNHIYLHGSVLEDDGFGIEVRVIQPNSNATSVTSMDQAEVQTSVHEYGDHGFCVRNANNQRMEFYMSVEITEADGLERFERLTSNLRDYSEEAASSILRIQYSLIEMKRLHYYFNIQSRVSALQALKTARLVGKWSMVFATVLVTCAGAQVITIRQMFRSSSGSSV